MLTADWNKYNENVLYTGSVDKTIRGWDIRNSKVPLNQLEGHEFAVRRIKCSPHNGNLLASVSYDMNCMVWDASKEESVVEKYDQHTEFVLGVDWNCFVKNLLVTAGWDQMVNLYKEEENLVNSCTHSLVVSLFSPLLWFVLVASEGVVVCSLF